MALQAIGSFCMCTSFCRTIVSITFSGQINVIVLAGAAGGVVRIQMSGAIWAGKLVSDAFHIFTEHLEVISVVLFAYRAAKHDGWLESGWYDVVMLQN